VEPIRRVAGRDRAAFNDLCDRLMPLVYGISKRVVRDPSHTGEGWITDGQLLRLGEITFGCA
jgi:hypothetical protein